ncbi:MAG: hypothetical protein ACRDIA_06050, partial [Actinomycetota bacterium]
MIEFTECRPDLLMIREVSPDSTAGPAKGKPGKAAATGGQLEIVVIDAKATDEQRLAHRIQATLYSLILEHILLDHGLGHLKVSREGGVWLHKQPQPELFGLSGTRPPLETFLSRELTPILQSPAAEVFWHLYYRCEWCDFQQHCRAQAEETDNVSLLPYLSTFAKRHLAQLGIDTTSGLKKFLKRKDADLQLQNIASLRGKRRRLQLSLDSIESGDAIGTGAASVAMPRFEDVRIVLTLQSEPLSGHIYGYAIYRFGGGPPKQADNPFVFDQSSETVTNVCPSDDEKDVQELRRQLIRDLFAILKPVHDFNEAHPSDDEWRLRKSVQAYVFDVYERDLLVQALLAAAQDEDQDIARDAMALFFHFQHPDLTAAEEHPADEVFFPIVILTQVIRNTFALPIQVHYRFDKVVAALKPAQYSFDYRFQDYFDFELSNRLKSDAIFWVWFKERDDLLPNIEGHLKRRVRAANSVINGLRERLSPTGELFAYPPKFQLPVGTDFRHPLLSRLAFVTRYEYVLRYLDQRGRRAAPEPERLAAADSLRLTFQGGDKYALDVAQADLDIAPDRYWNWILTHDTPDGRESRLAYDDAKYREAQWAPKNLDLA